MICFYTRLTATVVPVYSWTYYYVICMITRVGERGAEAAQTFPQPGEMLLVKKIITKESIEEQGQALQVCFFYTLLIPT